MKMKQVMVTIPENCELKQDGNTYTIVEKENKLTYEDVIRELFYNKSGCYIDTNGAITYVSLFNNSTYNENNNCTSGKQAEKLLAINKLMNVAKYLNGDWQPNWNDQDEDKHYLITSSNGIVWVHHDITYNSAIVYFKSQELAEQAIEILGEDTIKLALCTDY